MKNNKGLSQVVTTLIIILLVIVAVGIIWGVVNNLLDKSKGTIESSTRCMDVDVKAIKVVQNTATNFSVTFKRTSTGEDISGMKVVIFNNATENTEVIDVPEALGLGATKVVEAISTTSLGVENAITKIEVTPYFTDDAGSEVICSITNTNEF